MGYFSIKNNIYFVCFLRPSLPNWHKPYFRYCFFIEKENGRLITGLDRKIRRQVGSTGKLNFKFGYHGLAICIRSLILSLKYVFERRIGKLLRSPSHMPFTFHCHGHYAVARTSFIIFSQISMYFVANFRPCVAVPMDALPGETSSTPTLVTLEYANAHKEVTCRQITRAYTYINGVICNNSDVLLCTMRKQHNEIYNKSNSKTKNYKKD